MKKHLILSIFFLNFAIQSQSQKGELNILTFSEVELLNKENPKPIVVFIYTDWCKFCHGMKKNTLKNDEVISLLNKSYYFIKLNGEEKKDITFLRKTFVYKPTGANTGIHELAHELALINKKISYPTTTILNSKFEIDAQLNGYVNSRKLVKTLKKLIRD